VGAQSLQPGQLLGRDHAVEAHDAEDGAIDAFSGVAVEGCDLGWIEGERALEIRERLLALVGAQIGRGLEKAAQRGLFGHVKNPVGPGRRGPQSEDAQAVHAAM